MTRSAFESMVRRMSAEVPADYFDGVTEVVVSPRTVPHPTRPEIYTLGECIPLPLEDDHADTVRSRVVLYYGSFRALAELDSAFDWEQEAWETLTHELRHHVEWRARRGDLEALDRAAEQNYARQDGQPFEPLYYLDGERMAPDIYKVEDDWFLDRVVRAVPPEMDFDWHGLPYRVVLPPEATLPAYLLVDGLDDGPPGELFLVAHRAPGWRDLWRPSPPFLGVVQAKRIASLE